MAVTVTQRARMLASTIRKLRKRSKMNSRELSRKLGFSHSTVSHWENCKRIPDSEDVASLLGAVGVTNEERERILDLARHAAEPNWLTVGMPDVPEQLAGVVDCETEAKLITEWSPCLIPGLLQTAAYARATLTAAEYLSHSDIESRVFVRMGRRELLSEAHDPKLNAFVGEAALREPVAPPEVMAEQLRHLAEVGQGRAVRLRVVRSGVGWHPGLHGPFVFYDFEDAEPVVHLEHFSSGAFIQEDADVAAYRYAIGRLDALALSETDSHEFVLDLSKETEPT